MENDEDHSGRVQIIHPKIDDPPHHTFDPENGDPHAAVTF